MIFIDDVDFDGPDGLDDDFQEDIFENEFESEIDDPDGPDMEDDVIAFGFQETFIIGGMIAGQAWEEVLDEREQRGNKENDIDGKII